MARKLRINDFSMEVISTFKESPLKDSYLISEEAAEYVHAIAGAYRKAADKSSALYHTRQDMDACERLLIMDHVRDAQALMALSHMIPRLHSTDRPVRSTLIEAAETGEIDYATVYYAEELNKALSALEKKPIETVYVDVAGHHDEDKMAIAKKNLGYTKRLYEAVAASISRKLSAKASGLHFQNLRINLKSVKLLTKQCLLLKEKTNL